MLSTWLDETQTWAEPDSLSCFQRAIPLEWISQILQSTDKASIRKRKLLEYMIKTRRTKRIFSPEFRLEAVGQVVKYQRDVQEVAQSPELNPDHLRKWIRLYRQEVRGTEPAGNAIIPEQREIQQLKAQIKRPEMEKERLKQAAVLMSEIPGKSLR